MEAHIVHLSDLHFKNDAENRKRLEYLLDDLKRLRTSGPIYTAFTGDLVNSGDNQSDYEHLFELLIGPLTELGHEVLTVPGNHDIQRSTTSEEFTDGYLQDTGSSYLFGDHDDIYPPDKVERQNPLANYMELEELLGPYDQHSYYGYSKTKGSISFVGMNSTWLSRSRSENESDRGKLRIEPFVLEKLAKSLPPTNLKIALLHHPLDWLEEHTRSAVTKLLTQHFDIALFGHVHTNDASKLSQGHSDCLYMQSPPLRANWSKGTNGYSIIRANVIEKRFEVEYRSYSASRRLFVAGEDFAKNGRSYPRPEDGKFYRERPSEDSLLMRYRDADSFDYTAWYRENIRAKSKKQTDFSIPKVRALPANQDDKWLQPAQLISETVKNSIRDQFYIAPPDSGLTTAAFVTFKTLSENFDESGRVAAFFDAREHKIDRASILREVSRTLLVRYTHAEIETLALKGSLSVIVDGLSLSAPEQFNLFRDVAEKYFPSVRFLYFISTERRGPVHSGSFSPKLDATHDEIYDFVELDVSDIREMVSARRQGTGEAFINGVVSQVVESFRQMDEPIFASSVAVVVETLSQDPEFKPLNKARLLERYVECLLGRFNIEDVQEGAFASSDKIDLLSFIARSMLENDIQGIDENKWSSLTSSYSEQYLIDLPSGLLDEFIEKGILTVYNKSITFRGDYLFSFFVARQMKADPTFAGNVTTGEALFKYHKEIAFYGDLEGTDTRSVLNTLHDAVDSLEAVLDDNYQDNGISLSEEWLNTCAEQAQHGGEHTDFVRAADDLGGVEPTPEKADRFDNQELSRVQRRRGVAERLEVKEAEARLLVSMKLYALLLKNSLQVPGPEKLRHIAKLYQAAEVWVGFLCANREDIVSKPIVLAGGVRIINMGAILDPDKSAREFKYNAPNALSRILSDALRNPQLSTALRRLMPNLSPMGSLFARDALLDLPNEDNRKSYVESIVAEEDINLATASLKTLRVKFLASGRSKEQRDNIEGILLSLQKHKSISGTVSFDSLKKARLLRDMKENAKLKKGNL
ncbi:metallophosphoesterase [Thalassovita mangrovi]|uniref:Calcineurin-like phosphoesterase domain-containing protein n=1 Tax=Thalassovita mangrovi TaxID=2692236 RepID=A0A6L8LFW1_9RHOB|nr:metallophosphoesterase [Thalassovita mangrovi]MYM54818.1 hypothetical protein [Thalassovita mangrovi]